MQWWEGNFEEALATVWEIASACGRSRVLVNIARIRARNGDLAGTVRPVVLAVEAAEAVGDSWECALALVEIAGVQAPPVATEIRPEAVPVRDRRGVGCGRRSGNLGESGPR